MQLYSGPEKIFWHVHHKAALWLLNLNVNLRLSLLKKNDNLSLKIFEKPKKRSKFALLHSS